METSIRGFTAFAVESAIRSYSKDRNLSADTEMKYAIVILYRSCTHTKFTRGWARAIALAESAVYDGNALGARIFNENGDLVEEIEIPY